MINKENLDKRICDVEGCENTQTYREFIRGTEEEFECVCANLNNMSDEELKDYLDFMDELWDK